MGIARIIVHFYPRMVPEIKLQLQLAEKPLQHFVGLLTLLCNVYMVSGFVWDWHTQSVD